jgi:alanine racemase
LFEPPPEGASRAVEMDTICSVYTEEFARALSEAALDQGKTALVHVKVDSGMHRVGVAPGRASAFATAIEKLPGLEVTGIYTHFAVASEPDDPFTSFQIDEFEEAFRATEKALGRRLLKHAANSAGLMAFPRSHYDMVRVGIAMLGLHPSPSVPGVEKLEPALTLRGEVALVKRVAAGEGISYGLKYAPARDSNVATLPVGYADGWSRMLSGKADVLIGGKRRLLAGTICMDVCMVDLGDDRVEQGEPFVLIGSDAGEVITAEEVADKMGTINYEVACMISSRVPRVFLGERGLSG